MKVPSGEVCLVRHLYGRSRLNSKIYFLFTCFSAQPCLFQQVSNQQDEVAADCISLGGDAHTYTTMESCKDATITHGGNAFNFLDNKCYFKTCDDVDNWKRTTRHGGYNVYMCVGEDKLYNIFLYETFNPNASLEIARSPKVRNSHIARLEKFPRVRVSLVLYVP